MNWEFAPLSVVFVAIYDWGLVSRASMMMPGTGYRYWPFRTPKAVSLAALGLVTFFTALLLQPPIPDNKIWETLPFFGMLIIHGIITFFDLLRQKRILSQARNETG